MLSRIKYVRKKIKAGTLEDWKREMFEEIENSRDLTIHTGGRKKSKKQNIVNMINLIIEKIKAEVADCEKTGEMFKLPVLNVDGVKVVHESLKGNGSTLYHDTYHIELPNGDSVDIDYQSKDKCRSFSIKPDRSYVVVKCSNPSFDFSDAWDENS